MPSYPLGFLNEGDDLAALGLATVTCLFFYPVAATVWDVSKERYLKERAAKRAAKEASQ